MSFHRNAKLGLAGRYALVCAIEEGMTLKQAAACFSVSPATSHRWWHRWLEGDRSSATLLDRSSRPHRQPRRLSAAEEEPILRARRETNLGPGRLAGIVRRARSTIWKVLQRHGLSRRPRGQRQTYRRYEWSRPGAPLLRRAQTRPAGGSDDRQRDGLPQQPPLRAGAHGLRSPPHPHPGLHTPLERQSRALHPNPAKRMGLRPNLAHLKRTRPLPA